MAFETACQFRDMMTCGRGLIDMCVAVVSARERPKRSKYGVVVSDQFDEADPASSRGWRAGRFPSVKPRIEKGGHHDGRNQRRQHVRKHLQDEL